MIPFSRHLARHLRAVIRLALNVSRCGTGPTLSFSAGPEGLRIRAQGPQVAVEYCRPGAMPPAQAQLPYAALSNCQGRTQDVITLRHSEGTGSLAWHDHGVPQQHTFPITPSDEDVRFPPAPPRWVPQRLGLVPALADASATADSTSSRYALNTLQLQGSTGRIVATDGRHLLRLSGFTFPWQNDPLIPSSSVFGSAELDRQAAVALGQSAGWISLRVGLWTFHFKIDDKGRFPRTNDVIPSRTGVTTHLQLTHADVRFLKDTLPRLPGQAEEHRPVTLELQETIAIRARAAEGHETTELVLEHAQRFGEPIRVSTDRTFLARALELGFRDFYLQDPRSAMFAADSSREYVWMLLAPELAVARSTQGVEIRSPQTPASARRSGTSLANMATHTQILTLHALANRQQVDLVELLQDGFHVDQPGELSALQARRLISRLKTPARKEAVIV